MNTNNHSSWRRLGRQLAWIAGVWIASALPAHALQWEQIGPAGGAMKQVSVSASTPGLLYGAVQKERSRIYMSSDSGFHWIERPTPDGCRSFSNFQLRSDGDIFLQCGGDGIWRSHDEAQSWSLFSPVDAVLVFDPLAPQRAVVAGYATTLDDGRTWTKVPPNPHLPFHYLAFDPRTAGRLVAVGTQTVSLQTNLYESWDYGLSWAIVSDATTGCGAEIGFTVDPSGRIFIHLRCETLQSVDGGKTWQLTFGLPDKIQGPIIPDPSSRDRWLTRLWTGSTAGLFESHDAGATWQPLPAPPQDASSFDIDSSGDVWIATSDGMFVLDSATGIWAPRSAGIFAQPLHGIVPSKRDPLVLSAWTSDGKYLQSFDEAKTWQAYSVDGNNAVLIHNINVPGSVFTATGAFQAHKLYTTDDAGATWRLVNSNLVTPSGQLVAGVIPVGPQPSTLYAFHATCDYSGFTGCQWAAHGVAKSSDGGATWAEMDNGLSDVIYFYSITVSPASPNVAYLVVVLPDRIAALYVTRDGARSWQPTSHSNVLAVIPDPLEPGRVYLQDKPGNLRVSTDYAATSRPTTQPPVVSPSDYRLLVDWSEPRILYAIGETAEVAMSKDRGESWERIVEPSEILKLDYYQAAQLVAPGRRAIYAGAAQGVLKLELPGPQFAVPMLGRSSIVLLAITFVVLTYAQLNRRTH